jgi:hypothetical protein
LETAEAVQFFSFSPLLTRFFSSLRRLAGTGSINSEIHLGAGIAHSTGKGQFFPPEEIR